MTSPTHNGRNIGYLQVASEGSVSIEQKLPVRLQSNKTYTLTAKIGRRNFTPRQDLIFILWSETSEGKFSLDLVNSGTSRDPQLAKDTSGIVTLRNTTKNPDSPDVGGLLSISIAVRGIPGTMTELFFDDFSLTVSEPNGNVSRILPQLAFGGGWSTALYFTNLLDSAVSFPVNFTDDNGSPLIIPSIGSARVVDLAPRGSTVIEALNIGPLTQGYASMSLPQGVTGYGVFRQSIPGVNDQEAVVPLSGTSENTKTLVFDETNYATAVSLVNLSSSSTIISATARNSQGFILSTAHIPMPARGKKALYLETLSPGVRGVGGSVEFVSSAGTLAVLGLRFNGLAFTSIPTTSDK